ncbi:MAG TPA: alpha-mannosidase [Anaerolineales bacterium]|nr:alpha-mannosidase [Anaerolineales bacterium]
MYHRTHWTPEKIKQRLELISPLVYIKRKFLPSFRYRELDNAITPPPVGMDVDDAHWQELNAHEYWGAWMQNFILRTTFAIPEDWDKTEPIALHLPFGEAGDFSHPEALAYIDGEPYAACDRHHQEILLKSEWADGKSHTLALHGWTGLGGVWHGDFLTKLYLQQCAVVQIHQPTRDFIALSRVALEMAQIVDENNPTRYGLLTALNDAFVTLDTRDPLGCEQFYRSVETAMRVLQSGIEASGTPLEVVIHATGHAHIDIAWLWTLGQTRRKAERTFYNVIRLMEQFPEYHFTQSQPQLYQFIKEDQPALFESIQQKIKEGRWEPIGGMWVEADCNLSGAESLARQFLLGRAFFREHFGKDAESPVLWLPDVFGYAWALPQLIQQAGLKYFMTIKIGWSQYNRLPYDTFLWQGIDGTQILTHFSTVPDPGNYASTYNAMADAREALGTWKNFQQKELHKDLLMAYGFGDGGGGPTREMLENIEIMRHFPALPQVKQSSVRTFFEAIATLAKARGSAAAPVWNGELYLEYHRGTYTTQARNKRANRKAEFLLHDTEFLCTYASLLTSYQYPIPEFQSAWRTVCLNQFHDIIPGSSIGSVYEESQQQYAELTEQVTQIRADALEAIADKLAANFMLVNATSFTQPGLVFIPGDPLQRFTRDGKPVPAQPADSGLWVDAGEIPAYSMIALQSPGDGPDSTLAPGASAGIVNRPHWDLAHVQGSPMVTLENNFIRVEFNTDGDITHIFDKQANREVLAANSIANQFQAFEDRPKSWDAWDIEIFYDDKMWLSEPASSIEVVEYGELRQTIEIKRRILNSFYTQRISLDHNSARLDFDTYIDWKERHIMLKVAFPVDILSPQATYEIQWGNVQRPTHRNTSWDWARFETCAHKWADLSEGSYGVSLLNDCKYGHDIHENVMRITLLRSPTMPDPTADSGEHQFKYSLYPHMGSWNEATQKEAYLLNDPILVYRSNIEHKTSEHFTNLGSLISVSSPNVIIETVKRAEDGDGIIVRLYESQRKRGPVQLQVGFTIEAAWETNLLEENETVLSVENNSIQLNIRPYQIMTIRLKEEA